MEDDVKRSDEEDFPRTEEKTSMSVGSQSCLFNNDNLGTLRQGAEDGQ